MTHARHHGRRPSSIVGALLIVQLTAATTVAAQALDLSRFSMVDLTHELSFDATA